MTTAAKTGNVQVFEDLDHAVANAWLVIEAVPEKLELKISTFAALEKVAPEDSILATNSSSYKSSEMVSKISEDTKRRVLNTHYYMPPHNMVVELMTDGCTHEEIFPFLSERFRETAALPYVARKESTGFIFNRLWAAVKRETLTILSEGVSNAAEIDSLWAEMFTKGRALPCETMDNVGLDTVALIEGHYIAERGLSSTHTLDYLQANYLDHGKLGSKCDKGGLYPPNEVALSSGASTNGTTTNGKLSCDSTIVVLDIGLSAAEPGTGAGEVLQLSTDGSAPKSLISGQALPDGIAIDHSSERMFWTCMGEPGDRDGALYSAKLDGTDQQTVVDAGKINTPKQLCLDTAAQKVYFCDREGCAVYRCNYDGSDLEVIAKNGGTASHTTDQANAMNWCVGIALSPSRGKFYWSQKGPSKGGRGRIFSANMATPEGKTAETRDDIKCILYGLPEPIDLDVDEENSRLYWTDRGELPWGNTLNRVDLDEEGMPVLEAPAVLPREMAIARRFHEAIGLKVDSRNNRVYVTDLGGSVYVCDLDGKNKKTIYQDEKRAFTGLALL